MTRVHSPQARLIPTETEAETCFKCGTVRVLAGGIGTFCPSRDCDAGECTSQEDIDRSNAALAAMTERFRLKRRLNELADRMTPENLRALLVTASAYAPSVRP